jgi:hypothetical protein
MFRKISKKLIEPLAMVIIVIGIVCLCQPWVLYLHRKGFLITGIGLALFIFFSHVKPPVEEEPEEEMADLM